VQFRPQAPQAYESTSDHAIAKSAAEDDHYVSKSLFSMAQFQVQFRFQLKFTPYVMPSALGKSMIEPD
jgi:hypothetical protein